MERITWATSRYGALRGTVGTNVPELFTIASSASRGDNRVELRSFLPGGRREWIGTAEEARTVAETWLAEHVRALGAELLPRVVINGDGGDPEECGLDATCRDCGDGETAMSEEYATRWAKAHRCDGPDATR
jgi:hypothetical protein